MVKYWIKNRLIFDLLIAVVLSLLFSFVFIYPSNSTYYKIKNENNIYLNSNIDYQIPNPSVSQLSEIKAKSFVEDTFGYYLTKTTMKGNKSAKVSLLMSDNMSSLAMTMYNEKTKVSSITNTLNYAYIDKIAANSLGVECGDELTIDVANAMFKYIVCGIYETNQLFNEGSVLVEFANAIKTTYEANVSSNSYSAAFIDASNETECSAYLRSYVPLGRLKDRSEFDSDEAFNTYNNAIISGNYSNEITNFGENRIRAQKELVSAESSRTLMSYVGAVVVGVVYFILSIILRKRKSENKYFKDVLKNKKSINIYRLCSLTVSLLIYCIVTIVVQGFFKTILSVLIPVIISVAMFVIAYFINMVCDKAYVKDKEQ